MEKDIKIEAGKKPNTQVVTFKSTSAKIDKKAAVAAIGAKKDQFVVVDVQKKGEKKAS